MASLLLGLALGACGALPVGTPRNASQSLESTPAQSPLAQLAADALPPEAASGFRLLPLGPYALDARLALIRNATRSVDLQVYIMENDASGRAVFGALRDAAERGVRVRLLLDDLNSAGAEPLIETLAGLPNFEIRLFNPFCCARGSFVGRLVTSAGDLPRLDHRMHNKLMIADGALAIVGGRNIADEYFGLSDQANFIDLDGIAAGRVVPQLGAIFDRYWNSEEAYPARALTGRSRSAPDPARAALAASLQVLPEKAADIDLQLPEQDLLGRGPVSAEIAAGRLSLLPAVAYAVADRPSKLRQAPDDIDNTSLMAGAIANILGTRSDIALVSPYLVPGQRGMSILQSLQLKGVDMTLVTNSLPANDSVVVYFGYARYRKRLLQAGVKLYEISASPSAQGRTLFGGSSRGRLHAKLLVIDHQTTLLGSLNLDPRSARENTEVGVAIDSPAIAAEALRIVDAMKTEAYRVQLDSGDGRLSWLPPGAAGDASADAADPANPAGPADPADAPLTEPGVSPLTALERLLLRPLVPEDQL